MPSVVLLRPSTLCLTLCAALGFTHSAQADFLYGRLKPAGTEPNGDSLSVDVSSDGRTVVFSSAATNWAPLGFDYNGDRAVAVDLDTGIVEVVSVPPSGAVFRGETPAVSGDGRYVAFLTYGTTYGPSWQVMRKDRETGALELASATAAGQAADGGTNDDTLSISADGRYVAFETASANFGVPGGSWGETFVKDMTTGAVKMASVKADGSSSGGSCELEPHALSDSGRYIVLICSAAMVPGATTGQAYVRDLQANTIELISRSASAASGSSAFAYRPAISPNGRFVSFQNRGYGGLGYADGSTIESNSGVYLRDRQAGTIIAVPRPAPLPSDRYDGCNVNAVSDVGSVLLSCAMDVGQPGSVSQVFLFVPGAGAPELLSVGTGNQPANGQSGYSLAVNASGLSMTFESAATNIDASDTNGKRDIFVLVEESVLSDVIFANGFDVAPTSLQAGRIQAVPAAAVAAARD
jgi:hypothetical protein